MRPRTWKGRLITYLLLLAGSAAFLFPFVWMLSTSLKPIEQTTKLPPDWVPHDDTAPIDGERVPVIPGRALGAPMLLVRLEEGPRAGQRHLAAVADWRDGRVRMVVGGVPAWYAATLLKEARADWQYVTERLANEAMDAPARWDVVDPKEIETRTRLFWEEYPIAIRKMGWARVWMPFLGERIIPMFWVFLRNTLIVAVLGVIGTLVSCSLAAYSLARIPWRGRRVLFVLTLATMMVPVPVLMVPLYGLFKSFGWIGTLLPLWVPTFFGTGFNIFLLRQFFLTIPREISDAARIDGCSEFGIFWRIILPLSRPALAVVGLFHFLYAWNDFIGPLLYLARRETYTLSLGLQHFQSRHGGMDWTSMMAASTLVCLPVIVLFFFTQRLFIRGTPAAVPQTLPRRLAQ